jgi:high-affinity iron transporter
VLREGSETVLFLYGIAASEGGASWPMLIGGLAGIAAGIGVGYALYAGLLRIPLRWFFAATGILVLFLAAGMASQAARFLIQADVLPSLANPVWDTSALLPQTSLVGTLMRSLVGYEERPAGMQIVFYVLVLIVIGSGMKWLNHSTPARRSGATS